MQDPEIPPEGEGEVDGGAVGVHLIIAAVAAAKAAIVIAQAALSIARRWITAIVRYWAMITATKPVAACAPALPRLINRQTPNRFPHGKTTVRASLHSSMICSSWPRSRRQHAR